MQPQVNWDVVTVLRPSNAYRLYVLSSNNRHTRVNGSTRAKSI